MSSDHNSILQREELQVLQSIYPECILSDLSDPATNGITLEIPIRFDTLKSLSWSNGDSEVSSSLSLQLSYLPPILLQCLLPATYPRYRPPLITAIRVANACSWLPHSHLSDLQSRLTDMWTSETGEGVLYDWVEFIQSGKFLGDPSQSRIIDNSLDLERLEHALRSYQHSADTAKFSETSHFCPLCLNGKKGYNCVQQLNCPHVTCRECIKEFWGFAIRTGDVHRVGCPDPECVKAGREATQEEVIRVVTVDELARWKWLKLKKAMEMNPRITHCPICQEAVEPPPENEQADGWDRLRTCPSCTFSFCAFCEHSWHGPLSACPGSAAAARRNALVLEYMAIPTENTVAREAIERSLGRTEIRRLVRIYLEEKPTADLLEKSTTICPGCGVRIEKSLGCNHMTCTKCNAHFCFLCGGTLKASTPYTHYNNNPSSPCYRKLFDIDQIETEWQPVEGFDVI